MIKNKQFSIITLCVFVFSLCIFKVSTYFKQLESTELVIAQIEKRIALDLPRLDLTDAFLKHSGNHEEITHYIKLLNNELPTEKVKVYAIADVMLSSQDLSFKTVIKWLTTNDQSVSITFLTYTPLFLLSDLYFVIAFFVVALLFARWADVIKYSSRRYLALKKQKEQLLPKNNARFEIDLKNKTLGMNEDKAIKIALANKPLCFYLALIEFCIDNPDVTLNQNKDVPVELLELANKYFYRLIELGHTIRKRPNFTNSLEKTLSEIRAALDEILSEYPELKDKYYPPKAHGEGSRSRLHSYGLVNIKADDIVVIGK
ncbi:hypothetical protein AMS58_15545 [Pseudoalteromonas porphyrae]|uniref:Uncharacterized protein n=1 Tax=Pseudoalteromonas porphyrae TaxID=187330 RepID=A0A0N1EGK7_9GAMM|nr:MULTISPECIES: hypothetical protein [Pseudoalteromonas]KPH58024.1 hypothetical protein ADS77_18390 [Pseudoalteromonas porphyrae]KPH93797.1 hypothetical protein AMS58_15545 [Pseudoalteromonas porphyrae]NNG43161.1 hypothetical protein [Pseudoalteromonas sp. NEC-BIFX-2020_002]